MFKKILTVLLGIFIVATYGCETAPQEDSGRLSVPFEKFELANGLEVVFHIDRSDPVVAVALTAHVGSAREKVGRTGFAHLFEHLLFLESENLGKGGLDKLSARIGGSGANGSTSRDRTNYFQTVPNDALEKMIWAEADKLGWFINTVTDPVLAKEKQVVKNEKRQSIDNRPYGHTSYVVDKHMYPEDHPYNWQVIGSLEDLQNATLSDVKEFFRRWYVPNNVTLVISGDFDVEQAKAWVHQYFDEIPRGEDVPPLEKRAGQVAETVRLYHEDNFARLPELTLNWPTVPLYHADSYALSVLCQYLARGKEAPLYQVLVEQEKLTSGVRMANRSSELAGATSVSIRAFDGVNLDDVLAGFEQGLADFEAQGGIPQIDLDRIKAGQEAGFYRGLSSVLGKGFQLAQYNIFAGDPGFIEKDIANTLAVTREDVWRVYTQYLKGKPYVATSFVPKAQIALALEGSEKAVVVEEAIVQGAEERFDASQTAEYEKTPSSFDRSQEPPYGNPPVAKVPDVWEETLENGLKVYGIESTEVPLVQFNVVIDGGQLHEELDKTGVANLVAQMLTKGTAQKTPAELEAAILRLGASILVRATKSSLRVSVTTLAKNYQATLDLVQEIMLTPRWDEGEFELLKQSTLSQLNQQLARPNAVANNAFNELIFGADDIRAKNVLGEPASIDAITIEDLQAYYSAYVSPSVARWHLVGDITKADALASLEKLARAWPAKEVSIPKLPAPEAPEAGTIFFYDIPGAKQSVLNIGTLSVATGHPDYFPNTVMNYILGGGGFASRLTQELREGKGYTYGIGSGFNGQKDYGTFSISSNVRSNVTLESTQLIKEILEEYPETYSTADLETTKGFLIKRNARAFETANAKLQMLENISYYGWEYDYVTDQETIVKEMTEERVAELAKKYTDPNQMIWLVVGDADTQLSRMEELGYGKPTLINVTSTAQ